MRKIDRLKKEAREACEWRGHKMGNFFDSRGFWSSHQRVALCKNFGCGAMVVVDSKPDPNGIDISGDAVAVNCPVNP